jgi:hypothetical protein
MHFGHFITLNLIQPRFRGYVDGDAKEPEKSFCISNQGGLGILPDPRL